VHNSSSNLSTESVANSRHDHVLDALLSRVRTSACISPGAGDGYPEREDAQFNEEG